MPACWRISATRAIAAAHQRDRRQSSFVSIARARFRRSSATCTRLTGLETRDLFGRGFFRRVHVADRPAFLKLVRMRSPTTRRPTVLRLHIGRHRELASAAATRTGVHYFDARTCHIEPTRRTPRRSNARALHPEGCHGRRTAPRKRSRRPAAKRTRHGRQNALSRQCQSRASHARLTRSSAFRKCWPARSWSRAKPKSAENTPISSATSGIHLHEVVSMILDMSKIESGSMQIFPEPFSCPSSVEQCCDMIQIKADQGQGHAGARVPGRPRGGCRGQARLQADPAQSSSNAVKFTPRGAR